MADNEQLDQRRRRCVNENRNEIRRLQTLVERDEVALEHSYNQDINDKMEERRDEIKKLEKREGKILSGELDKEIQKKWSEQPRKRSSSRSSQGSNRGGQRRSHPKFDVYHKGKYEQRKREREIQREYRRYLKTISSLPDYLKKKLRKMPNNKGFIWRDVWFWGDKKEEKGKPLQMFQNRKGGIQEIHIITRKTHKIYEKPMRSKKKTLIFEKKRNVIN